MELLTDEDIDSILKELTPFEKKMWSFELDLLLLEQEELIKKFKK